MSWRGTLGGAAVVAEQAVGGAVLRIWRDHQADARLDELLEVGDGALVVVLVVVRDAAVVQRHAHCPDRA